MVKKKRLKQKEPEVHPASGRNCTKPRQIRFMRRIDRRSFAFRMKMSPISKLQKIDNKKNKLKQPYFLFTFSHHIFFFFLAPKGFVTTTPSRWPRHVSNEPCQRGEDAHRGQGLAVATRRGDLSTTGPLFGAKKRNNFFGETFWSPTFCTFWL